jgi:omega-amidase
VAGFHRHTAREATPDFVLPALRELQAYCAELPLAIAVGAPTFGDGGAKFISHLLIAELGEMAAAVSKQGLTDPEATFFTSGSARAIGVLQGPRCSAVICREVEDNDLLALQLPRGAVDLVFTPSALRQDPDKPRTDPPEYVRDLQRLAGAQGAHIVQTSWPNALNRLDGEVLFRLPAQTCCVVVFALGERGVEWHSQQGQRGGRHHAVRHGHQTPLHHCCGCPQRHRGLPGQAGRAGGGHAKPARARWPLRRARCFCPQRRAGLVHRLGRCGPTPSAAAYRRARRRRG